MIFNEEEIRNSLKGCLIGKDIFFLKTVDSTNTYARKLIRNGSGEGSVVIADRQTKGKGRFGRKWYSPARTGAWMSIVLKPVGDIDSINLLDYICVLSIAEAVYELVSTKVEIKWPNDILADKKKICGVLSEVVKLDADKKFIIAGIGLNINQNHDDFPKELSEVASSIRIIYGKELEREKVIVKILQFLEKNYKLAAEGNVDYIFDKWLKWCTTIGKRIRVVTSEKYFEGTAVGINPDGKLKLKNELNEVKEVTPVDIIQIIEYIN